MRGLVIGRIMQARKRAGEKKLANENRAIDFESIEKLSKVLGAFDENLNFLARELDVIPYVDGVKICLQG